MKPKEGARSKIPTRTASGGQRMITDLLDNTNPGGKNNREQDLNKSDTREKTKGEEHGKVTFLDPPKEPDPSSLEKERGLVGTISPSGITISDKTPIIPIINRGYSRWRSGLSTTSPDR